jgi:hypothetical protein
MVAVKTEATITCETNQAAAEDGEVSTSYTRMPGPSTLDRIDDPVRVEREQPAAMVEDPPSADFGEPINETPVSVSHPNIMSRDFL